MLILPRASHPLREELRKEPDERRFRNQVALTAAFTRSVRQVADQRKMSVLEMLDAILMTLTAFLQARAPVEEWETAGAILADELRARLTVTGDTGDDDHPRKWV